MELTVHPKHNGYGFVIVLPGGGYRNHAEHETYPPMDWLAAQGWRAGALPYTVDPSPYPVALLEVLTAVGQVRAGHYGPVTGPVGVLGFSAGGHLAGLALTATEEELARAGSDGGFNPARPDFGILAYPVVTMGEYANVGSRESLLSGLEDPTLPGLLSIENRVSNTTGSMFVWTTADDQAVPAENSLLLAQACVRHHVPVELHIYPHGAHGLGMTGSEVVDQAWAEAGHWLRRLGE